MMSIVTYYFYRFFVSEFSLFSLMKSIYLTNYMFLRTTGNELASSQNHNEPAEVVNNKKTWAISGNPVKTKFSIWANDHCRFYKSNWSFAQRNKCINNYRKSSISAAFLAALEALCFPFFIGVTVSPENLIASGIPMRLSFIWIVAYVDRMRLCCSAFT